MVTQNLSLTLQMIFFYDEVLSNDLYSKPTGSHIKRAVRLH